PAALHCHADRLGRNCFATAAARGPSGAHGAATSGVDQHDAGIASATLHMAQQVGVSLGAAVLNTLAASVTPADLAAGAPRTEGLVHGYAAAAALGAVLLLAGAAVSATLRDGRGVTPSAVS